MEGMLVELNINKHNFSKIGKYISNKLHHIHKGEDRKRQSVSVEAVTERQDKAKDKTEPVQEKRAKTLRKKEQWYQPCVGTYHVNYSTIDKNIHLMNFNRSTPHFHGLKYKVNTATPFVKDYPDGLTPKSKGFTELRRMVGRQEIKGSIRKNLENPHEARFQPYKFPNLALDNKGVSFNKMSDRKEMLDSQRINGAEYECDFELKMRRLDSHIIPFKKQTSRPETLFEQNNFPDTYRYENDEMKQIMNSGVEWSKQLAREVDGVLPGYMERTVTSRMAVNNLSLKTLQMNCSDMKDKKKLQKRRLNSKERAMLYSQTNRQSVC